MRIILIALAVSMLVACGTNKVLIRKSSCQGVGADLAHCEVVE